jgi:catechol 2,3-dioxygenase-like lactoylglutathione lyase family enzyme
LKLASFMLVLGASLAPLVTTAQTPPATTGPVSADYDGAYYKRQLYVVTDMERALTLWRDVMGLQPGDITTSGPNSYSREVFNIPARAAMRFCTLSAGPNQVRTLALLEVKGVRLPRKTGIRTTGAVINANGRLDAIIAAARAKGLTIMGPRVLQSATQGTGIEQGFLDWDGNVIVLYQFPKADAPSVR